jgi:hypothetical protein
MYVGSQVESLHSPCSGRSTLRQVGRLPPLATNMTPPADHQRIPLYHSTHSTLHPIPPTSHTNKGKLRQRQHTHHRHLRSKRLTLSRQWCRLIPPVVQYPHLLHMSDPSRGASAAAAGTRSESPKRKHHTEATTIRDRLPSSLEILVPENSQDNNHASEGGRFSPSLSELDRCDSPRSNVAARFEALEIYHEADDAPRKRVKTTIDLMRGERTARFEATPQQSAHLQFNISHKEPGNVVEIAETPGCRLDVPRSSPTSSPLARQTESLTHIPTTNPSPIVKISPKRMRSPPPPLPTSTSTTQSSNQPNSTKPPPKNHHKAKPDVSGLTWQDSEITGHEIHRSLGDDGEGINGVGFRPTPAIAQARRQKRKHQLSEWRAREAREARQRRFEKRQQGGGKGCSVDLNVGGDGDEGQRRVVRFEEIG